MERGADLDAAERSPRSIGSRLRRRNVVQWGLAYLAGAFALVQGIDLVATHFAWPAAVMRLAVIAAAAGVPIALVLAWYHGERGEQHVGGAELGILIALLVVGGLALRWAASTPASSPAEVLEPARRAIAVMPLENLGADANFAAGLHDELIARLSLIQGIDVVSRTSTLAHHRTGLDARQIGTALGASHLLEGTLQRDGGRVRLRLQFIDARNDRHLFARTMERDVTDVFQIQALIATEIAESLRVALTSGERAGLQRRPTAVAEAYDAYLAAREAMRQGDLVAAVGRLETAVDADPAYIDARALLTDAACQIAIHPPLSGPLDRDWRAVAREHAAVLRSLAPEHAKTHLAAGTVAYWIDEDLERGRVLLDKALAAMPNEVSAVHALHWIHARLGNDGEAERLLDRLDELEPGTSYSINRVLSEQRKRRYVRSLALFDRATARTGATIDMRGERALLAFRATGDVMPLRELVAGLSDAPAHAGWRLELARRTGDDATARALVASFPEFASLSRFDLNGPRDMYLALVTPPDQRAPLLRSAEVVLDRLAKDAPDDAALAIFRGWTRALGGDHPSALVHFRRAEALMSREVDRLHQARLATELARGYALAGAADDAQRWLAACLEARGGCHAMDVRHDTLWRPLRADPRTDVLLRRSAQIP